MVLQAAASDIQIEFVDGVNGQDVPDRAIPRTSKHDRLANATIETDVVGLAPYRIVYRNLTSALILEDDVDWDVRIRDQLADFALSSNALLQPLSYSRAVYADPTFPVPPADGPDSIPDTSFENLPSTKPPVVSPYGDDWDVLWVGHCGMQVPMTKDTGIANGRIVRLNDMTTAARKYLWNFPSPFILKDNYPEHTRMVHHVQEGVCSLGYALSQRGARKLLFEVGLKDFTDPYDLLLRYFCEGTKGRKKGICLTTQPSLITHFRPAGPKSAMSDIGDHGDEFIEKNMSDMIRLSVRLNTDRILDGDTELWDQCPDE
ncbi:hypothetical protein ESCO_004019 [Escovopsis weberi]|uniref:Procollagen galactosyltransferase 1 n=1 Tax=Escovopsis weberi TaxID=150374 RepID=A0A0M9VXF8_ESCWE|nr:hypothetical protein ESCO_004019 [Escovopsis weberi]